MNDMPAVYLYHIEPPYKHARHYLGSAKDIMTRADEHAKSNGKSTPLLRAAHKAGRQILLVRVISCETETAARLLEAKFKKRHESPKFCPICQNGGYHGDN